jgi:uncharacterized protein YjbJ (UPF0337 family)
LTASILTIIDNRNKPYVPLNFTGITMISQIYSSLLTIGLIACLSFVLVFSLVIDNSWANISPQIATMERVKAVAKELEGKTQEAIGNVMGDAKNQIAGKAKQVEANVRNATEDVKDNVKLPERLKANAKNLEGKTQEAIGNVTGDRMDQVSGKAKQVEAKTRNLLEDAKDKVQDMFQ